MSGSDTVPANSTGTVGSAGTVPVAPSAVIEGILGGRFRTRTGRMAARLPPSSLSVTTRPTSSGTVPPLGPSVRNWWVWAAGEVRVLVSPSP